MKKLFKLLIASVCLLLTAVQTEAQTNLSVQGTVQEFDGSAVDNGNYDITFKLYEVETGGTAVWSETQSVRVTGGVYSVLLGEVTPLTAAFNTTYYLGITLPGGPELFPRSRLTSSPYALSLIGQDNIFPSTGAVGAGTASPTAGYQLHAKNAAGDGKVLVEGSANAKVELQGTDGSEIEFKKGANSASITYDGTNINIENLNLVFSNGLHLPAGQTVNYNGIADWRLIDTDDFDADLEGWVAQELWNNTTPVQYARHVLSSNTSSLYYNNYVLRPHINGNDALKKHLNLTGIPHTHVKVIFTYHFLDSWEGTSHGEVGYAGFSTAAAATTATYADCWLEREVESSGSDYWTGAIQGYEEYNKRVEMVIQNSADNLWIIVGSNLNQDSGNESYAIDNVEIWVK